MVLGLLMGGAGAGLLAACGPTPAATATPRRLRQRRRASGRPTQLPRPGGSRCDRAQASRTHRRVSHVRAPDSSDGAATPQPKSGGTLHYGLASPLTSIWPTFSGTEGTQDIYDSLLTYDTNLQPVPALVESWDWRATTSRSSSTCARASSTTTVASSPATT